MSPGLISRAIVAGKIDVVQKYRNRMVHFYDEMTEEELFDIISSKLGDFDEIIAAVGRWLRMHPERVTEVE